LTLQNLKKLKIWPITARKAVIQKNTYQYASTQHVIREFYDRLPTTSVVKTFVY